MSSDVTTPVSADARNRSTAPDRVAVRAAALHELGRRRARVMVAPVMADPAMNIMLSLFIAQCQCITVTDKGLLLANDVPPGEGGALLDRLVQAGLIQVTGETPGQRSVGLAPLGSARMRTYICDYPDAV